MTDWSSFFGKTQTSLNNGVTGVAGVASAVNVDAPTVSEDANVLHQEKEAVLQVLQNQEDAATPATPGISTGVATDDGNNGSDNAKLEPLLHPLHLLHQKTDEFENSESGVSSGESLDDLFLLLRENMQTGGFYLKHWPNIRRYCRRELSGDDFETLNTIFRESGIDGTPPLQGERGKDAEGF